MSFVGRQHGIYSGAILIRFNEKMIKDLEPLPHAEKILFFINFITYTLALDNAHGLTNQEKENFIKFLNMMSDESLCLLIVTMDAFDRGSLVFEQFCKLTNFFKNDDPNWVEIRNKIMRLKPSDLFSS